MTITMSVEEFVQLKELMVETVEEKKELPKVYIPSSVYEFALMYRGHAVYKSVEGYIAWYSTSNRDVVRNEDLDLLIDEVEYKQKQEER